MAKSKHDAVKAARADIARVISRSMRALRIGIGQRTDQDIKAGFEADQRNAPLWCHAAIRLGGAYITTQGQQAAPSDRGQLNIVVVNPAASVAAWQQQADQFLQATKPKVIDAVPVPVESKSGGK